MKHRIWGNILTACMSIALLITLMSAALCNGEMAEAAKSISAKHGGAIIKVLVVSKTTISIMGQNQSQEGKTEADGTIIDPTGLTVMALDSLGSVPNVQVMGASIKPNVTSDVTSITMIMPDGTEIPAKTVLRDKELGLAFIRPVKKLDKQLAFIDLKDSAKLTLMDEYICLRRLDKSSGRTLCVWPGVIQGIIEKPRMSYVAPSPSGGLPAISKDGKVVGITITKKPTLDESSMPALLVGGPIATTPIIIPAADVASIVAQAPEND